VEFLKKVTKERKAMFASHLTNRKTPLAATGRARRTARGKSRDQREKAMAEKTSRRVNANRARPEPGVHLFAPFHPPRGAGSPISTFASAS
jgi:hypothetical protein